MSFGGGTNFGEITAKTFTLANTSLGDIILVEFWSETDTDYMTGISGGGATWDPAATVAHTEYTGAPGTATIWKGEVTTAEGGTGATVTITTNAGSPTVRGIWTEISTTAGYGNVALDQSESTNGTTTVAGMTAGHGAGELAWGWQFNSGAGTATQNTPAGFTYNGTTGDANGNVGYWNLDCGTGSEAPTIGGGGDLYGLSLMLYETSTSETGTAVLDVAPALTADASGGTETYSLFSQATETVTEAGATGGGTLGVEFTVSAACSLQGIWLYSPSGQGLTALPPTIGLYAVTGETLVHSETASWSGAAGSGWVYAAFASPPSLSASTSYMGVVFDGSATDVWFVLNSSGWPSNITNGPLSALSANGGMYSDTATPISYPSEQLSGYNWYLDVAVSTGTAHTATATVAVSPAGTAAGSSSGGASHDATAALTVTPATTAAPAATWPSNAILDTTGSPILDTGGGYILDTTAATLTASATVDVTPAGTAEAAHGHAATATLAVTPETTAEASRTAASHTASATIDVDPAATAEASHAAAAHTGSASIDVTPESTAAATIGVGASVAVTPAGTAEASRGQSATASVDVTPETTADATGAGAAHTGSATLDVAPATAAEGEATAPGQAEASAGVAPAGTAEASHGHSATASISVTPETAAGREHGATASATVDVGPAGTADGTGTGAAHTATAALDADPATTATTAHGTAHEGTATLGVTPATTAEGLHGTGHTATASLDVDPETTAAGSASASSLLLSEDGSTLLAEDGSDLLAEAPGVPVSHTATAALDVTPETAASSSGYLLTEAGGQLLGEDGSSLLAEAPGLPAAHTATASLGVAPVTTARVSGGAPAVFPQAPLDAQCDLDLGGTWEGITTYAYQREGTSPSVVITRGRPDESSQANPAACTFELNNRDGRFSPKNPMSPYYGQLGRNAPVRWSVPASGTYLRLEDNNDDRAAIVEASRLDISGSIDMRLALRLTDWRSTILACKQDGGGCWLWTLNDDGTMTFGWQVPDGPYLPVTSTVPIPFTGGDMALRVTMNASTGTVTFYTTTGDTYVQLGAARSGSGGAATTIATTSAPLVIGWSDSVTGQLCGRVYAYQLYNGIGGTLVASPDFTAQTAGASSFADAQGNDWLIQGGAEISDRDYRFHGEVSEMPPKWDVTGRDMSVPMQAGGPLRRLNQGSANIVSPMRRAISLQAGAAAPVAYWPMEDNQGSTIFGPAIGNLPLTFTSGTPPTLAEDSSFLASAPLPEIGGSRITGAVLPYSGATAWTVSFLCKLGTLPTSGGAVLCRVATTGKCQVVYVVAYAGGGLGIIGYDAGGTEQIDTGAIAFGAAGANLWYSLAATPVSGGVQYALYTLAPGATDGLEHSVNVTTTAGFGQVTGVTFSPAQFFTDTIVGHLQVQKSAGNLFSLGQPLNGWQGETAAARYARLASENGYQCRIIGPPAGSAAMGAQGVDTLPDLLQECESADLGQMFEPRQQLALGYRTLASLLNQSPRLDLDYSASQPGGVNGDGTDSGLDPIYDDQFSKNDWTLTRGNSSGSSTQGATWQYQLDDGSAMSISPPPIGIGDYADTQTVNLESDGQLQDVTGWMVWTGTADEARWPTIPLNLARPEAAAIYDDALDTDIGDFLQMENAPNLVTYDPVKQLVYGTTESLGGFHFTIEYNAVPESPYETVILDDDVQGTGDTDGSQLAAAVSATATTLSIEATGPSGILWTTAAADLPLDINVGGERITAIGVSGTSSPQAFHVTRAVNGVSKAHSAGTDVRLWSVPTLSLA